MADNDWTVVGAKKKAAKPSGQPPPDQLAAVRAQVLALRAGKQPAPEPARSSSSRPAHASQRAPPASSSHPPAARAPAAPQPQRPATTQQQQFVASREELRRLQPLVEAETTKSKLANEKYYQAFVRCTMDGAGNLTYRFHKTDIVIVKANGDVKLTTGGWYTATTMYSMNDVLSAISIQVRSSGDPKDGSWTVTNEGKPCSYYDNMVLEATSSADQHRARRVMQRARELGIACFAYVRVGAPAGAAGAASAAAASGPETAGAARGPPAGAPGAAPPQQQQQQQQRAFGMAPMSGSAPSPSASSSPAVGTPPQLHEEVTGAARPKPRTYQEQYAALQALTLQDEPPPSASGALMDFNASKLTAEHYGDLLAGDVLEEGTECIACMAVARDTVILPCGHLVLCHVCSAGISTCPMCRGPVAQLVCLA